MYLIATKKKSSLILIVAGLLYLSLFGNVFSADLSISPGGQSVEEGKPFTVSLYITNNKGSVNGVAAKVNYPSDILKVTSVSKASSIIEMWSQDPKANIAGEVPFEGLILNPGFQAEKGLLFKIAFLPLVTGKATISLSSGNIYANDGNATDVLSSLGAVTYTVKERKVKDAPESIRAVEAVKSSSSSAIVILSRTHPNEGSWYAEKNMALELILDKNTTDMSYVFGKIGSPQSRESGSATPSLTFFAKEDGVYQMNVRQKVAGKWGPDSLFGVKVDTMPPFEVAIKLPFPGTSSKVFQTVELSAKDQTSGVSHFDVQLNGGSRLSVKADENGNASARLRGASFGKNVLRVTARDYANNEKTVETEFSITPLDAPIIDGYTGVIKQSEPFVLWGKTYPLASVKVLFTNEDTLLEKQVIANEKGEFSTSDFLLKPGIYEIKSMVFDYEGGQSELVFLGKMKVGHDIFVFLSNYGLFVLLILLLAFIIAGFSVFMTKRHIKMQDLSGEADSKPWKIESFFTEENREKVKAKVKRFLSNDEV